MRRGLISWAQSNDSGCAGVFSLLDVAKCSFSVTFHCSLTKTPEQLMGASEKPVNSDIPATCLIMSVSILPKELQMERNEVMGDCDPSRLYKERTVRHAVTETFDSSKLPDFTPKICRNRPKKVTAYTTERYERKKDCRTYMKTLYPNLSSPLNGRRLWRNEISGKPTNAQRFDILLLHRIQRNVEYNGAIWK